LFPTEKRRWSVFRRGGSTRRLFRSARSAAGLLPTKSGCKDTTKNDKMQIF